MLCWLPIHGRRYLPAPLAFRLPAMLCLEYPGGNDFALRVRHGGELQTEVILCYPANYGIAARNYRSLAREGEFQAES